MQMQQVSVSSVADFIPAFNVRLYSRGGGRQIQKKNQSVRQISLFMEPSRQQASPESHQHSNSLRILCISDTNNTHEGLEDMSGDILIHCGDFTKSGTQNEFYSFVNFLSKLNFKHKVVVAGHKDMTFDTERYQSHLRKIFHKNFPEYDGELYKSELQSLDNVYYLEHQSVEIEGIRIFGSPYQPMFFDCAFGREQEELKVIWDKVNEPIDILVTHCPPHGILDAYKGTNMGCKVLMTKIKEIKPKYHVFGHNRDCHGVLESNGTTFISCCRFDEKFKPINPPMVIDYKTGAKTA